MNLSRSHSITFIFGVLFAVFCLHAYSVYSIRQTALTAMQQSIVNQQNIAQLVEFLNVRLQPAPEDAQE